MEKYQERKCNNMSKLEEAETILKELDIYAPVSINWNTKELWIKALLKGLEAVDIAKRGEKSEAEDT